MNFQMPRTARMVRDLLSLFLPPFVLNLPRGEDYRPDELMVLEIMLIGSAIAYFPFEE